MVAMVFDMRLMPASALATGSARRDLPGQVGDDGPQVLVVRLSIGRRDDRGDGLGAAVRPMRGPWRGRPRMWMTVRSDLVRVVEPEPETARGLGQDPPAQVIKA